MNDKYATINGYNMYNVMSALQKCIRRGLEDLSLYWGFELAESKLINVALSRLRVMAHEDIGLGDPTKALFALRSLEDTHYWHGKNNGAWRLSFTNAILSLCRARKSRDSDNAQAYISHQRRTGWKPNIPDFAYDKHTYKGKKLGRGIQHFLDHAAVLNPDDSDPRYKEGGADGWLWSERTGKSLYPEPKKDEGKQVKFGDEKNGY